MRCLFFIIILLSIGCAPKEAIKLTNCNFDKIKGKEIAFVEGSQKYNTYYDVLVSFSRVPAKWRLYAGKRGKVIGQDGNMGCEKFDVVIVENCDRLYLRRGRQRLLKYKEYLDLDLFQEVSKLKGKTIYANIIALGDTPVNHLEKLYVVGFSVDLPKPFSIPGKESQNLKLKVQRKDGSEVYYPLLGNNYYLKNPIKKWWRKNIIAAIKKNRIMLGMSKDQVLLSWGPPKDIRRTVTSRLVHEQWIYGNHHYVYFDNGKLTSFQD